MRRESIAEVIECVDSNGDRYTVVIYQSETGHKPVKGGVTWKPGGRRAELPTGEHVNLIGDEDNVFQIATTEKILTGVDGN